MVWNVLTKSKKLFKKMKETFMKIDEKKFFEATKIYNTLFAQQIEQEKEAYFRGKTSSKIYILAYGNECTEDYDVDAGIFTSKKQLVKSYNKLYNKKQREIQEYGYSLIDTIKVYSYHTVNQLTDDLYNNKYRVKLEDI